jgi:MoaA/NifB/PqqE/SkfB family radical SAM enzyme
MGIPLPLNGSDDFQWKLWIYTNYDCNLRCSYCLAQSSPTAPRRALGLKRVQALIDEAVQLGFTNVFFTGGEPLLLDEIYPMLGYASQRLPTTLLTNAMLIRGKRLERLRAVANDNLVIQVSLDGGQAEHHDAFRGSGSWARTVEGIQLLLENGLRVRISTTETSANSGYLNEICEFHTSLGIPAEDHFIRPLARRGFSTEGVEVGLDSISPEITVNAEGIYWHPLATDEDMLVSSDISGLAAAVDKVKEQLIANQRGEAGPLKVFT